MKPLALSLYLGLSRLAGPLAPFVLRRRLKRGKEDPARMGERLGRAALPRPPGQVIWLHGASVGEAMALLPLIGALRAQSGAEILLTTGTVTSARRVAPLLPEGARHQFVPVDTAQAVGRFLDHWRPDLAIWAESELWPRLVTETARRGIAMAMVNARLSARSHARWLRAPGMARTLFGNFAAILAQDDQTVTRLADFAVAAENAGNLKALVSVPDADAETLALFRRSVGERPVWLAASTHPGEETQLLETQKVLARQMDALLILAPRHPDRADAVAAEIRAAGLTYARRSEGRRPEASVQVYLADSLGEMGLWYRLAPVSFVGGSLVAKGGHTPFEPIACGSAVLHGPHVENFAPAYEALAEAGAVIGLPSAEALTAEIRDLLSSPEARARQVQAARDVTKAISPDVVAIANRLIGLAEVEL